MEDFLNDVDASSEQIVDAQETEAEATSEVTEESVVEPAKPQQTAEENSKFAEIRRKYESEQKVIKAQNDRLLQALSAYGYQGSPEEIADALLAQTQGITVEEAKAQREEQERYQTELAQKDGELEFYRSKAIKAMMAEDLATIQKINPEVKSLEELGNEFFSYLGALKDAKKAYFAWKTEKDSETKPVPPNIGEVNASSSKEKDYYTPAEVDKLTEKDYENPKIMEVVRKSMLRWK